MGDTQGAWGPPKLVGKEAFSGVVAGLWPVPRPLSDITAPAFLQIHPLCMGGRGLGGGVDRGGRGKALVCSQSFADSLGCSSTSSAEMLQCLRQITNEEQILNKKLVCLHLGGRWQAMAQRGPSTSCGSREAINSLG